MTDKATFTRAQATGNLQSFVTNYNSNLDTLETALDDSLSLSGKLPNSMTAPLDMNSQRIINLADAINAADGVNKSQLDDKEDSLGVPAQDGSFLVSDTDGTRYWVGVLGGSGQPAPSSGIFDFVDFNTSNTDANAVGRLRWNEVDGTLDLGLKGGSSILHLGQKQLIRIVNKTNASLSAANYQCVKISGAQGQRPKVALAQANNDSNSADTIGLVNETIADNAEGFVCTNGTITNINTTGSLQGETWVDGDVLYLSGSTAGAITNVKPVAPIHTVIVGFVIYAHASQGKIFVKVDNGYEIDELHNVRITSAADKNVLRYNISLGVWENVAQTALTAGVANTVDNTNSTSNLSFWTGSQGQYDALTPDSNTLYFIT